MSSCNPAFLIASGEHHTFMYTNEGLFAFGEGFLDEFGEDIEECTISKK